MKTLAQVTAIVREMLDDLFDEEAVEESLPMPHLKLVNRPRGAYLGRCIWRRQRGVPTENTTIEIQRSILADESSLRRVLAHELIHHWQVLRLGLSGHGPDFQAQAARINLIMGADFVTTTSASAQGYDTSKVPPFYLLIIPRPGDRLGYSVALRPSAGQKAEIARQIQTAQARLFRITDGRLWEGSWPIERGGCAITLDVERARLLRELYATGTQVAIPGVAPAPVSPGLGVSGVSP